ncbi:helix-turn-helix domain-containing protein [Nonomuraea indica]|uniref:helix-turn-helix domain-containing protein n=1 Tax=Nonomuraea indica TaxID=1581193 RepID=UPI001183B704|nr:helix-turn-helix domain-containing protein [Nonomuraea indica]
MIDPRKCTEVLCACCEELGLHGGRGLCHTCYRRHLAAGTLAQYPRLQTWLSAQGRIADFAELRERGLTVREAAEQIGVSLRTAERYQARLNSQEGVAAA